MAKEQSRPFGWRDKVAYAFGDVGNDFTFMLASSFLMKFYTDVMGVGAGVIGIMMMAARIVDAFTDVTMGRIVDRSKVGKNGKFRPWILRGCGAVAMVSFLMYPYWFADMSLAFKTVWMFVSYLLWGSVFYTMVNIPYGSMVSAITDKPEERIRLSTFRSIGGTMANAVVMVGVPLVVYYTDENGNRVLSGSAFSAVAFVLSLLAVGAYIICYLWSTERISVASGTAEELPKRGFLRNLIHNRALCAIIAAAIFQLLAQLTMSAMNSYIYPNYYGNTKAQSLIAIIGGLATLIVSAFIAPFAKRFGKKEVGTVGALIGGLAYLVCFFLRPDNVIVFMAFMTIALVGLAMFGTLVWACITDVIDYGEIKNGVREDGTIYSVYSFARKLGQAASAGLTGFLLDSVGYTKETAFDPKVLDGIFNISCLIPAVGFFCLALTLKFLYPLNKAAVEENAQILTERRAEK